jgi:hypothetical protein
MKTGPAGTAVVAPERKEDVMPEGDVETYFADGMWSNKIEGGDKVGNYQTKDRAIDAGRDLARELKVEHIVKKQDGTIGERSSHGHDPRDIPG